MIPTITNEKSCGAILYCRDAGVRYLLIRQCNESTYYGFPKGHVIGAETERETALREIGEEVGVQPVLDATFRRVTSYPLPQKPGVTKTVVYFLGRFDPDELITIQPEEVCDCVLLPYEEAYPLLRDDMRVILHDADELLAKSEEL